VHRGDGNGHRRAGSWRRSGGDLGWRRPVARGNFGKRSANAGRFAAGRQRKPRQEGDAVAGSVGEAQAQGARIELNRLLDIAREQEDMREAPGPDAPNVAPERRATLAWAGRDLRKLGLLVGRRFRRDLDLDQVAVVIVKP